MSFTIDLRDFNKKLEQTIQEIENSGTLRYINSSLLNCSADMIVDKLKEQRGKAPMLEVKWTQDAEWKKWSGELPLISVVYPEDSINIDRYAVWLPFQEPAITANGLDIWDYRIDNNRSFREMRDSLTCNPKTDEAIK